MERAEKQSASLSNGHAKEMVEPEMLSRVSVEANIKSAMQLYLKCASVIVLDSWSDNNRYFYPRNFCAFDLKYLHHQ